MSRVAYFITHPNVAISENVSVTRWPLSELGRARMVECLKQPWIAGVTSIYSSTEQKAVDAAQILANHLCLPFVQVAERGENDRSSTGFLPPGEFELMANEFFEKPEVLHGVGNAPSMLNSALSRPLSGCSRMKRLQVRSPSSRMAQWELSCTAHSQASGSIASGISRPTGWQLLSVFVSPAKRALLVEAHRRTARRLEQMPKEISAFALTANAPTL